MTELRCTGCGVLMGSIEKEIMDQIAGTEIECEDCTNMPEEEKDEEEGE